MDLDGVRCFVLIENCETYDRGRFLHAHPDIAKHIKKMDSTSYAIVNQVGGVDLGGVVIRSDDLLGKSVKVTSTP